MVFQPEGTNAMNESTTEHLDQPGTNGSSSASEVAEGSNDDGAGSPTEEQVRDALRHVVDPELGINIVDLGLVYDVDISDQGVVHIEYTLTTMGCPIGPLIEQQMQSFLENVQGVSSVDAEMVLRPPWTPEMMSEEAKAALGYF
jgi:metal-sulfur cluster biosynthetic enzyme